MVCIFVMLAGVIGFAAASGALTNYISQMEEKSANYHKKMSVLDKLCDIHHMPHEMYRNIKFFLDANEIEDAHATGKFVDELPVLMRRPLSMLIYQNVYKNVDFLIGKSEEFIAWICPILKVRVISPQETIYYENEALSNVYFLKSGPCNYVLPAYNSEPFLRIEPNTSFGLIDFIAALLSKT